jgi:phosphoribosylaminoimidazolecarboxamide formyltransferase / IMP cyclohydrolase
MSDLVPVKRALISLSDKTGLPRLAALLNRLGVEIISTGGTADAIRALGVPVTAIDAVTGFPEIMDGRVKTLHPKVHGGLLARRDDPKHIAAMQQHGIGAIDLVCVNLYPFEQAIAKPDCTFEHAIENIDIGGPSMIRSAAKNHSHVAVITSPAQYVRVEAELTQYQGCTTRILRSDLAAEAFALTSRYDASITAYLTRTGDGLFPPVLGLSLVKADDLRYGENPHQQAALYRHRTKDGSRFGAGPSIATAEQLHGKELSYNNINDAAATLELALALKRVDPSRVGACVVKHTNPCGSALANTARDAVDLAIAGDPLAAYGGIIAINETIDEAAAERLCHKDCFFEVVIAPAYSIAALAMLRNRWANVRILATGELARATRHDRELELRTIPGGVLVQERDVTLTPTTAMTHKAGPAPTTQQLRAASFLEATGRFLFSNAVLVGGSVGSDLRMFGAGAGQMDRVTSCRLATEKAGKHAAGAIAYSDAFFPFSDGPEVLIRAGVTMLVHPGGSKRDQDTFELCDKHGVTCVLTGTRHFRH